MNEIMKNNARGKKEAPALSAIMITILGFAGVALLISFFCLNELPDY